MIQLFSNISAFLNNEMRAIEKKMMGRERKVSSVYKPLISLVSSFSEM